jgi:sodium transport system ATP-binding protein
LLAADPLTPGRVPHPTHPLIVFSHLTKAYGELVAVSDLSLRVGGGEVYALLGANGAGKTTALRCLATLLQPSAGHASIAGFDSVRQPLEVRRRLGFLAASMGLYQRLTARELLRFFAALNGMAPAAAEQAVEAVVRAFDLGAFADRHCGKLSTGQRQRVSIARAVVHDPPALVLDEPTLGLDVLSSESIFRFIEGARARGRAVVFSTHQMSEVELLADRVGIIAGGRLAAEGTVDELVAAAGEPNLARAFLRIVREAAA